MPDYIGTLKKEISVQKNYLDKKPVNTIYLGGGTPSLFNGPAINEILDELHTHFDVASDVEITIEANPDDVKPEWIREILTTPINRISLGVQSFFNDDLAYLNRVHSADDAERAIKGLQDSGLRNMTIDLIYGIPGLDSDKWEQNLNRFFSYDLPHLSAYALTVEEKT